MFLKHIIIICGSVFFLMCRHAPVSGQSLPQLLDSARIYKSTQFARSAAFSEKAYREAVHSGATAEAGEAALLAGMGCYLDGRHDEALKWYLAAERHYLETGDRGGLAATYNEMIIFYSKHGKYAEGDSVSLMAIRAGHAAGDTARLATSHNNRGLLLLRSGHTDSAEHNLNRALQYYRQLGDRTGMSYSLDYLASVYAAQGKSGKAFGALLQSRELKNEAEDFMGVAIITNNLGEALMQQGRPSEAVKYFREAREKAASLGFADLEGHTWLMEAKVLEQQQQYREAFAALSRYQEIRDQVLNEKRIRTIEDLQAKYETDKKEQENTLLQEQNRAQQWKLKQRQAALTALVTFILLGGGVSWLLYNRSRLRQQARFQQELMQQQEMRTRSVIEAEENERQRIARELHDGVIQMLAATRRSFQSESAAPDRSLVLIDESIREVRQLSHNMMPPSLRDKTLADALAELILQIRENPEITIHTDWTGVESLSLDTAQTLMLYRALQEIFSNILRHAAARSIHFEMVNHDTELSIMVYDDGRGFDTKTASGGLGLKNIRSRVEYIGGTLDIHSVPDKGSTYIINLPLTEPDIFRS